MTDNIWTYSIISILHSRTSTSHLESRTNRAVKGNGALSWGPSSQGDLSIPSNRLGRPASATYIVHDEHRRVPFSSSGATLHWRDYLLFYQYPAATVALASGPTIIADVTRVIARMMQAQALVTSEALLTGQHWRSLQGSPSRGAIN